MKRTLTSIAAAALVLGAMSPAAFAASTANSAAKVVGTKAVVVDGTTLSNPYELTAVDSGNTTAYFGIYYFNQALEKVGYTSTWDGTNHIWNITAPGVDASKIQFDGTGKLGSGNTTIEVNGVVVKYINTFSHVDPAGGSDTTYFPVFYVNNLLSALGVGGSWDAAAGLTVTSPKLAVASVSAANADQIKVVFSQKVDATTAEDVANYSLNGVSLSTSAPTTDASASLQGDGRTVIITSGRQVGGGAGTGGFANLLTTSKTGYVLTVNGVKSSDGQTTLSNVSSAPFVFTGDTEAPTLTSVSAKASKTTNAVTLTFSEPVSLTGLYYVDGAAVSANVSGTKESNTVTLTTPNLTAGSTHTLQIVNEADTSGNYVSVNQNFSVTADTVAPVVTSVTPNGDNKIHVVFSKAINPATFQDTTNLKLFNGNGSFADITAQVDTVKPSDSTDTAFDITLLSTAKSLFNSSNQLAVIAQFGSGIADTSGNTLTQVNKDVTLTLNTAKPAVVSGKYVVPGTSYEGTSYSKGAVVLTFTEPVKTNNLTTANYTAITDKGVVDTNTIGGFTASAGTGTNELILVPNTAFSGTNTETVTFLAGSFTDSSLSGNTNSATFTQTFNLKSGVGTTSGDTTAPTISAVGTGDVTGANVTEQVKYTVTEAVGLDYSSVLNTANYRLNNAALPVGAYITTNGGSPDTVVTINLPVGSVATSGTYSLTILGIKDTSGNVASTSITNSIALTDNTAPALTAAVENADKTVTVTFGEALKTDANAADFNITVDGVALSNATDFTVAPGVGADAGKYVITFAAGKVPTTGQKIVVTTTGLGAGLDAAGNHIAAGGTATVYGN